MIPMKTIPDNPETEPQRNIACNIFDNDRVSIVSEGSRVYNTYSGDTVYNFGEEFFENNNEQAGAELCQAQTQVGLTDKVELILMLDVVFHGGHLPSFQNCFRLY